MINLWYCYLKHVEYLHWNERKDNDIRLPLIQSFKLELKLLFDYFNSWNLQMAFDYFKLHPLKFLSEEFAWVSSKYEGWLNLLAYLEIEEYINCPNQWPKGIRDKYDKDNRRNVLILFLFSSLYINRDCWFYIAFLLCVLACIQFVVHIKWYHSYSVLIQFLLKEFVDLVLYSRILLSMEDIWYCLIVLWLGYIDF